jgi:hypothetical protein
VNDPTTAEMTLHELCSMLYVMGYSGESQAETARQDLLSIMSLGDTEFESGGSLIVHMFKFFFKPRDLYKFVLNYPFHICLLAIPCLKRLFVLGFHLFILSAY